MNILFINASPKHKGNISAMLEIMRNEAEKAEAKIDYIHISELKIKPCTGCMSCRKRLECTYPEDDAQHILTKIKACDAMVIGTPCYWGNMPGNLKVLFDRIAYGMIGEGKYGNPLPLHKGKRAIIVSTCSTPWPFNILSNMSYGVVKSINMILKCSGFKLVKTIQKGGTRNSKELKPSEEITCRKAICKLLK